MSEQRGKPVAVIDIGSNSVRLVAYDGLQRAMTPVFNEKVLCGLGRGVATTGLLAEDAMNKAVAALRNFRALCRNMQVADVQAIATAATRDARNGSEFLARASEAIGVAVVPIGGEREAELSAFGVVSSLHRVDGVVGDLGGGSLELVDVRRTDVGAGVSLPIGGLALADLSDGSPKRAARIVRSALADTPVLARLKGRTFYAVGGTWRALARLHMRQRGYPLDVMHGYTIAAGEADEFGRLVERVTTEAPATIAAISAARRPLLGFGAAVLDEIMRVGRPAAVVISASGVREGLMYERLSPEHRRLDPLLAAAAELNRLRSRDPVHGEDLCAWTGNFFASLEPGETDEDKRLRHAACLMADAFWRAHPDDRSAQALATVANGSFSGVDHAERVYLALAVALRHGGLDADLGPQLRTLVSPRLLERARLLAAGFRLAYILSAARGGVLGRTALVVRRNKVELTIAPDDADLASDKVSSRLKQLARLLGCEPELRIER